MKKILISILILSAFIACEKNLSSIGDNVSIHYTGNSENNMYEFRVSNNTGNSVRYLGYNEGSPLFITSVPTDTGWVIKGPWWCGTGLYEVPFNSGDSYLIDVRKPDNCGTWRAGIYFFFENDDEETLIWSRSTKD